MTRMTAAITRTPMSPTSAIRRRLFTAGCAVGKRTGEAASNEVWLNTGRSSTEPTDFDGACLLSPRQTCAIERMSIRPEPSFCAMPELEPEASEDDEEEEAGAEERGESLASAARLLSENRTEFSLRCPVRLPAAAGAGAAAAAAIAPPPPPALLPNRPPSSSSEPD